MADEFCSDFLPLLPGQSDITPKEEEGFAFHGRMAQKWRRLIMVRWLVRGYSQVLHATSQAAGTHGYSAHTCASTHVLPGRRRIPICSATQGEFRFRMGEWWDVDRTGVGAWVEGQEDDVQEGVPPVWRMCLTSAHLPWREAGVALYEVQPALLLVAVVIHKLLWLHMHAVGAAEF